MILQARCCAIEVTFANIHMVPGLITRVDRRLFKFVRETPTRVHTPFVTGPALDQRAGPAIAVLSFLNNNLCIYMLNYYIDLYDVTEPGWTLGNNTATTIIWSFRDSVLISILMAVAD